MPTIGRTPNYALALPYGGRQNWQDFNNGNFTLIDAVLATFVAVNNLTGLWTNNTAYTVGQNAVDEDSGVIYTAQVAHTSSGAPTTFLEERTAHPTYWLSFATAARNRGTWQTATAYSLNDFVLAEGTKYAMCVTANTSGATFAADLALGYWTVLIDLSTAGSLVLPVLSGGADANKVVMSDSGGSSYVINTVAALASLLNAAGLATLANPTFTGNPIAPTQTAEDNDTSVATTQYADRALRNTTIRVQTFSANGTYTPHAKMIHCKIECWGGGGGGGGNAGAGPGSCASGGGGGAGSYSIKYATPADIGASKAVTIGAAGTGATAGTNPGGNGGDTSVGVLCVGKGGTGGAGNAGSIGFGGLGGIAGTGDITSVGAPGHTSTVANATGTVNVFSVSGAGASSSLGGGGRAINSANGEAATGKAAGGSGGNDNGGSTNHGGGDGTAGYVIVTETCYG